MVLCRKKTVLADQMIDATGSLAISHAVGSRVVVISAGEDNAFCTVIRVRIIRSGKSVASPAGSVLVLEEFCALLGILMPEEEGIGCDPSIGVRAS